MPHQIRSHKSTVIEMEYANEIRPVATEKFWWSVIEPLSGYDVLLRWIKKPAQACFNKSFIGHSRRTQVGAINQRPFQYKSIQEKNNQVLLSGNNLLIRHVKNSVRVGNFTIARRSNIKKKKKKERKRDELRNWTTKNKEKSPTWPASRLDLRAIHRTGGRPERRKRFLLSFFPFFLRAPFPFIHSGAQLGKKKKRKRRGGGTKTAQPKVEQDPRAQKDVGNKKRNTEDLEEEEMKTLAVFFFLPKEDKRTAKQEEMSCWWEVLTLLTACPIRHLLTFFFSNPVTATAEPTSSSGEEKKKNSSITRRVALT